MLGFILGVGFICCVIGAWVFGVFCSWNGIKQAYEDKHGVDTFKPFLESIGFKQHKK